MQPEPEKPVIGGVDALMLVSACVDTTLRRQVAAGERPIPEFLRLEERHGVTLLDWTKVAERGGQRSVARSLSHAYSALSRARHVEVIFSDGEHVGIPLAVAMSWLRIETPHLVIGHHLTSRAKTLALRMLRPGRRIDRVLVHSPNQLAVLRRHLPALASRVRVVPYAVDTDFWAPQGGEEEVGLVVSAGREHRDYRTLLAACPAQASLFVADDSPHSPDARRDEPDSWPATVQRRSLCHRDLRALYDKASLVVVPVIDTPFPFGITTLLESMSMGKAVIVSGTGGLAGVVVDGSSGVVVPPGAVSRLRGAIEALLADPERRARLGQEARRATQTRFGLDAYVDALAGHLQDLAAARRGGP